jgi:hypothetical protein
MLRDAGAECVTLSPEAARKQFEALTAACPVATSLVIYGRPPLATTRAAVPEKQLGQPLSVRRDVQMIPRRERGLTVFRPVEPFDLRGLTNERIRVRHLVMDLVGAEDPIAEWFTSESLRRYRFNYDRSLG